MRVLAALGLLIMTTTFIAQAQQTTVPTQNIPAVKYEKYKLSNGLEVILSEDHRLPLVAVDVWYHVGAANERPGRTGFAHLFEHMMFQGSRHINLTDHFRYLESAGASDINGTTSFDRTNYFETLPANQLDLALWLESDRMGWLLDNLTARNLANQRDVVRNERRQGEAEPYSVIEEAVFHNLFPKEHPYYGVVIGSHADIESSEIKEVRDFHELFYRPNNATLAVVGDFDPKTIKASIEKYFGPIPAGSPVPKVNINTPSITSERRATVTDTVELPRVYMAWLTPRIYQPGDAEADLMARILGGGKSSRLYKKLVYDMQIAQDVTAENMSLMLGSVFTLQATAKPGIKPEQLEKAINEELLALQEQDPAKEELDRARNKAESQLIRPLERLGGFGGVADRLNSYNHYLGDPGFLPKDLARYDAVTPSDLRQFAKTYLTTNSRVVVYGVPGQKVVDDVPKREDTALKLPAPEPPKDKAEEAWRAHAPKPASARSLNLPVPTTFKLPNGVTVLLVERHNIPTLSIGVASLSGGETNPLQMPGLSSFTARMLQEGTQKRSALQLADDADQIGADLTSGSNPDSTYVMLGTLSKNAEPAFELISDVVLHPAFRDTDIERQRKLRLTSILQQKDNPYVLADKYFFLSVYGEKHPYAFLDVGTEQSITKLTRDDVENFYRKGYGPQNSLLVVTGDITPDQLKPLAEKYFGSWSGTATRPKTPEVSSALKRHIVIIDKPGAGQTMLRVGQVGLPHNTPDYAAAQVMNAALGGLFSSRINMNLREVHGYTYGAFSSFHYRRGAGPFFIGTAVRTDATAPAVTEIFKELDGMRSAELKPDELAMAKDAIARSLAGEFESNQQTAVNIGNLFTYELPLDYYNSLPAKVDAVTAADVQRVAQQRLSPGSMIVVAVGDREKIAPEVVKLDLGTVEALDVNGKPLDLKSQAPAK